MYQNSKVVLLPPNRVNRKNNCPRLIHVLKKADMDKFKICQVDWYLGGVFVGQEVVILSFTRNFFASMKFRSA